MYHLIYTSYANREFSESDLFELLDRSRATNKKIGITGMLLYLQGKFIQVLEGSKEGVKDIYQIISLDNRHKKVTTIIEGESPKRLFKDWSMGFKKLTDEEFINQSGFEDIDDFFENQLKVENKSMVLIFLQLFYKKNNVDYA